MDVPQSLQLFRQLRDDSIKGQGNTLLQGLSPYLQENDQPCSSHIKISPPFHAIPVCECILDTLLKRGNLTEIHVPLTHHRLIELSDSVEISTNSGAAGSSRLILKNTSFRKIELNLINKLIINNSKDDLSNDAVQHLLSQILTNLENHPEELTQYPGFYDNVVVYIFNHFATGNDLLFCTVKHVIKHTEHYTLKFALQVAKIGLQYSENCHSGQIAKAAQYVIESCETEHRHESKMSAVIYIVINACSFSPLIFTLATNHFFNHREDYSERFSTTIAQSFMKQNASFFTRPIGNQQEFVQFYTMRKKLSVITDYSDKLTEILKSDNRKIKVESEDYVTGKLIPSKKTILELWHLGYFDDALENKAVALFILQNAQHEAIVLWRNQ